MTKISFPNDYDPSCSSVHARNELFIPASAEAIWFWLTNATSWPEWYSNASDVVLIGQKEEEKLKSNSEFIWTTFNTKIISHIKEYVPNERLAWIAKGTGLTAYHSWLIIPKHNGCQVITEETQKGWLPKLFGWFIKKGLLKQHQNWLESLKMKAVTHIE